MKHPTSIQSLRLIAILAPLIFATTATSQQKLAPQVNIDLKPLGVASDLFSDQSDSKVQQRGLIEVFWLGNDRIAVGFSTSRRWSSSDQPEPLKIHLVIFDSGGKQLQERFWNFSGEGPDGAMTLDLAPGPENSILAVFNSHSMGRIPDGDYVQILNADASLRQNFYIPATSAWAPSITPEPTLVLQNYFANRRSSFTWWTGKPLKAGATLDLPAGQEETLPGPPGLAARANCANPTLCFNVRVYRPEQAIWSYSPTEPELTPVPRVFLNATSLVVELHNQEEKKTTMVVAHPGGAPTPLPAIPHGLRISGVTSVSSDGGRFALNATGEAGLCGLFSIWCNQRSQALVVDVASNKFVFDQEISPAGGTSSLSPDGKRLAILDKGKLTIYSLP